MELIVDAPQKSIQATTAQVIMAGLIDIATALGLNSQTCSIHLSEQTPDISTIRQLIDRLLRDAKDIGCLTEKLQRVMMSEVDVCGREFSSSTGVGPQLLFLRDHRSHGIGGLHRDSD
jgi:hypothetical protein